MLPPGEYMRIGRSDDARLHILDHSVLPSCYLGRSSTMLARQIYGVLDARFLTSSRPSAYSNKPTPTLSMIPMEMVKMMWPSSKTKNVSGHRDTCFSSKILLILLLYALLCGHGCLCSMGLEVVSVLLRVYSELEGRQKKGIGRYVGLAVLPGIEI